MRLVVLVSRSYGNSGHTIVVTVYAQHMTAHHTCRSDIRVAHAGRESHRLVVGVVTVVEVVIQIDVIASAMQLNAHSGYPAGAGRMRRIVLLHRRAKALEHSQTGSVLSCYSNARGACANSTSFDADLVVVLNVHASIARPSRRCFDKQTGVFVRLIGVGEVIASGDYTFAHAQQYSLVRNSIARCNGLLVDVCNVDVHVDCRRAAVAVRCRYDKVVDILGSFVVKAGFREHQLGSRRA